MRRTLLATAILASVLALGGAAGYADPIINPATGAWQAPIGHLQPRSQPPSPGTPVEQAEQQQLSTYDAQQQKVDEQLDKQLNICRGC
jgi:hypothetical protein